MQLDNNTPKYFEKKIKNIDKTKISGMKNIHKRKIPSTNDKEKISGNKPTKK